jgi:hypothetical protein
MTDNERRTAILKLIEDYTARNTVDAKTARAALIREGICDENGDLRPEFGGKPKKAHAAR